MSYLMQSFVAFFVPKLVVNPTHLVWMEQLVNCMGVCEVAKFLPVHVFLTEISILTVSIVTGINEEMSTGHNHLMLLFLGVKIRGRETEMTCSGSFREKC